MSIAAAEQEYAVVIVCRTRAEDLIGLPGDYKVDRAATAALRKRLAVTSEPMLSMGLE